MLPDYCPGMASRPSPIDSELYSSRECFRRAVWGNLSGRGMAVNGLILRTRCFAIAASCVAGVVHIIRSNTPVGQLPGKPSTFALRQRCLGMLWEFKVMNSMFRTIRPYSATSYCIAV